MNTVVKLNETKSVQHPHVDRIFLPHVKYWAFLILDNKHLEIDDNIHFKYKRLDT